MPLRKPPTHWIEIELVGEDDRPIPWQAYTVLLRDGTRVEGYLDDKGLARIEQIAFVGDCQVCFPDLDKDAWERLGA